MENKSFRTPAYKKLACYQKAEAVFDVTYLFCTRHLSPKDRTFDQMIQAARSGKQNIVEGQAAYPTSVESALKLTNVAKASLHELKLTTRISCAYIGCNNGPKRTPILFACGL